MGLNMCPYCAVNSLQQKRLKSLLVRWLPKLICPHHCLLPVFRRMRLRIIPRSSLSLLLQARHFHRGGYRLHPFSSSCFISSKSDIFTGLPAPPLFILLFQVFENDIFTERVTGSTPFHPLVSYLQKRHFHREGYRLHPFSSSSFKFSKTAFSP